MSWQHGYHTDVPYTCGFYRELAPGWLDWAARLEGQPAPRGADGTSFTYLELGSGMGLGLCLLAAAYPEGQFTGIDFQPDHIAHSQRLASALGLTNVRFLEADFLHLADSPGSLGGVHHYAVAHGIATWITPPVRAALFRLAAASLRPGGLFYCSYNTLPGWLAAVPLQQLAWHEAQRRGQGAADAAEAVRQSAAVLSRLLGPAEAPLPLGQLLPGLRGRLEGLARHDNAYLVQEYINEGWQPLSAPDLHAIAGAEKLRHLASASLPENFLALLPAGLREVVQEEADPSLRALRLDLAIHQSFRRDLFCRGRDGLTAGELAEQFSPVRFRLQEAPAQEAYSFESSFGRINGRAELYSALEASLAEGPQSFANLQQRHSLNLGALAQALSLLLHAGRVGLDRGPAGAAAVAGCERVNTTLHRLQCLGRPYAYRTAPAIGTAVGLSLPETLLEESLRREPEADPLPALTRGLERLGRRLTADPGATVQSWLGRRAWLEGLGVFT
jgi:SAM-dependent methyltransferase